MENREKYIIVHEGVDGLAKEVNQRLKNGYDLLGSPFALSSSTVCQAMLLHEIKPISTKNFSK